MGKTPSNSLQSLFPYGVQRFSPDSVGVARIWLESSATCVRISFPDLPTMVSVVVCRTKKEILAELFNIEIVFCCVLKFHVVKKGSNFEQVVSANRTTLMPI